MEFNKKYLLPLVAGIGIIVFITSASVLIPKVSALAQPKFTGVNIFDKTKNECPGIRWVDPIDSAQMVFPITVEGELFFAGERVPLEDPDVRERLEREIQVNAYWHSNTLMSMKLANRYFGDIEKILADNGVPTDFKYLALVESSFRNETSPAGAVGFWQFVKPTAKGYGLEVNDEVDERYNYEKSTQAACIYLNEAKQKLGTWTMAAASYNMGMAGAANRMADQKVDNYYDMFFNQETSRYVFRILALKIIFSNPQRAGFFVKNEELYQPYKYKTVEVDTTITNIANFATQYGLKYKHIKILNPWLRDAQLTNKEHKKYSIKILEPK